MITGESFYANSKSIGWFQWPRIGIGGIANIPSLCYHTKLYHERSLLRWFSYSSNATCEAQTSFDKIQRRAALAVSQTVDANPSSAFACSAHVAFGTPATASSGASSSTFHKLPELTSNDLGIFLRGWARNGTTDNLWGEDQGDCDEKYDMKLHCSFSKYGKLTCDSLAQALPPPGWNGTLRRSDA